MENKIKVYCDGGSRGNPGKSASAFVVESGNKLIYSESKYRLKKAIEFYKKFPPDKNKIILRYTSEFQKVYKPQQFIFNIVSLFDKKRV